MTICLVAWNGWRGMDWTGVCGMGDGGLCGVVLRVPQRRFYCVDWQLVILLVPLWLVSAVWNWIVCVDLRDGEVFMCVNWVCVCA